MTGVAAAEALRDAGLPLDVVRNLLDRPDGEPGAGVVEPDGDADVERGDV